MPGQVVRGARPLVLPLRAGEEHQHLLPWAGVPDNRRAVHVRLQRLELRNINHCCQGGCRPRGAAVGLHLTHLRQPGFLLYRVYMFYNTQTL
jgi:hypothetical protein